MSTLTVQFLIVSILPTSFLLLALISWRRSEPHRRLAVWWGLTLCSTAVWSSSLLTTYLQYSSDINPALPYTWSIVGNHALSLTGLLILLTTTSYLSRQAPPRPYVYLLPLLFWVVAGAIDPAIGWVRWANVPVGPLVISQFQVWGFFWVASWLWPTAVAWLRVEKANHDLPISLYRSQVVYWFVTITLLFIGGALALLRGNIIGQQIGAVILLAGAGLGTQAIKRTQLPNLQTTVRQFLLSVGRFLFILLLAWGAFFLLTQFVIGTAEQDSSLIIASGLFAVLLLAALRFLDQLDNHFQTQENHSADAPPPPTIDIYANLHPPAELADQLLTTLNQTLPTAEQHLYWAEEAPAGATLFRPIIPEPEPLPLLFTAANPLLHYFTHTPQPLAHQDIISLPLFQEMPPDERNLVEAWQQTLYIPLLASQRLIGLLTLTKKEDGTTFNNADLTELTQFAAQAGPILWQARNFNNIQQINQHIFSQKQRLAQENRRLQELVNLYTQFTNLLSPDLRQPFTELDMQIYQLQGRPEATAINGTLATVRDHAGEAQAMIDNLIAVASQLEKQREFSFEPLYIDTVLRTAIKNMKAMADARRVEVDLEIRGKIFPIYGDQQRLVEAIQQLVHNALKFSRLGDHVLVTCEMKSTDVRIQVIDYGVGIPPNRMDDLWQGLDKPFSRRDQGQRRRTRVGLPLVRFIVKSHGGDVAVNSVYGKGSTFTVQLPTLLHE